MKLLNSKKRNENHAIFKIYVLCFIFSLNLVVAQQTVIFRFNADYNNGSPIQNNYTHNVDISTRVDEIEEVARGHEDSWGYSSRKTAYFPNNLSYISSSEPVIQSYFGAHTISGEVWIKPFEIIGQILSWGSDNENSIGFEKQG